MPVDSSQSHPSYLPAEPATVLTAPERGRSERPSLTLFGWLNKVLEHARLLIWGPLGAAILAAGASFLLTPRFSATALFYPETPSSTGLPANLAGIAERFGFSIGGEARQSTVFYADLIHTRQLLTRLLETRFPVGSRSDSSSLLKQIDRGGDGRADSLDRGVRFLRDRMSVSINPRSGVGSLVVQLADAKLASNVANNAIELVNEYNRATRQTQARQRRVFAEDRVRELSQRLELREDSLRRFYEANVQWQTSPRLRFEEARLARRVNVQEGLLTSLQNELESARIAEVNEAPVVTLVDPAVPAVKKSWPRRTLLVVATWLVSALGLLFLVSLYEYREYLLAGDPEGVAALRRRLSVVRE